MMLRYRNHIMLPMFVALGLIGVLWVISLSPPERMFYAPPLLQPPIDAIEAYDSYVCVWINQRPLWEGGDVADELTEHIIFDLQFWVDGVSITPDHVWDYLMIVPVWEDERIIGTHGSELQACFDAAHIHPGLHLATFQVTNLSGDIFNYSWAFHVSGVGRASVPTFPPRRSSDAINQ